MIEMSGKVVAVTGAGHGIGRVYCEALAAAGAVVVALDIDGPAAIQVAQYVRDAGADGLGLTVDVSDAQAVAGAFAEIAGRYGRLDGLVNNAAIFATVALTRAAPELLDSDEWDRVMSVNVKGAWLCASQAMPLMRDSGGGSIVNISSETALIPSTTPLHYVTSKAALMAMSQVMACWWGVHGIRVNTLAPGATLSENLPAESAAHAPLVAQRLRAIQRVMVPEDLVGSLLFLLSELSASITGQVIVANLGTCYR
jgi:3-oxoacyl-[acyl-carrier protein] reductase